MGGQRVRRKSFGAVVSCFAVGALIAPAIAVAQTPPWMDPSLSPTQRANLLVAQMTLVEKVDLMTGDDPGPAGTSAYFNAGIPRLGIPELRTADAGAGIARSGPVTAFPAGIAVAATWDPALVPAYARAVADEARATRHNVVLGPNADIVRNPWWGRVGETESEDPLLTARMVDPYVRAGQARNVIVGLKHYNVYSQETNRANAQNAIADERTVQEIYTPGFEAGVRAGMANVMCSFNKLNGVYACENNDLLQRILRTQLGFDGFVITDFGASHSTVGSINAGLNLEAGFTTFYDGALLAAVRAGQVSVSLIDQRVREILRAMFRVGLFDNPLPSTRQPIP